MANFLFEITAPEYFASYLREGSLRTYPEAPFCHKRASTPWHGAPVRLEDSASRAGAVSSMSNFPVRIADAAARPGLSSREQEAREQKNAKIQERIAS